MLVRAELDRVGRELALDHRSLDRLAVGVEDRVALGGDLDHIAFFQVADVLGDLQQGRGVGSQEILAGSLLAHSEQQRRSAPRADHGVGFGRTERGDGIGSFKLRHGQVNCLAQALAGRDVMVDQVRDHLGVGIGGEAIALRNQAGADLLMVLDDAVVHHRNLMPAASREMRVGVVLVDPAVGRPAGMGDAGGRVGVDFLGHPVQFGDPPDGAHALDLLVEDRDSGRIVAAVLELTQAFDQDWHDVAPRCGSYDSTHALLAPIPPIRSALCSQP